MKRVIILLGFLSVLSVFSCKKDDKVKEKTTLEKVQAKWGIENITIHFVDPSQPIDTTVVFPGTASDYFEFKTDGKAYSMIDGESDISTYGLSGDSSIIHENFGTYKIVQLTDNVLKLYQREQQNDAFFEETLNLKK